MVPVLTVSSQATEAACCAMRPAGVFALCRSRSISSYEGAADPRPRWRISWYLTGKPFYRCTKPGYHGQHPIHFHASTGSHARDRRLADADLAGDLPPRYATRAPALVERLVQGRGIKARHRCGLPVHVRSLVRLG